MKKDLEQLLHAYGKATQLSPSEELVERTLGRMQRQRSRKIWLVLAAVLGLPLLYAPLIVPMAMPMSLPQLLLFSSAGATFYNALIIIMWLTRSQLSKFAKEVL